MDYDIYSYEDVYEQAMKHFNDNTEAVNLWLSKIALKDSNGNLCERTPDDSLRRVAHEIARVECRYSDPLQEETIYELFKDFRTAVPSTSLLAGIGDRYHISPISKAFAIGGYANADSYGAIFKTDEEQVQLMKRRTGVSHDISHIRPCGFPVKGSALTSSGLLPFVRRYIFSMNEVLQKTNEKNLMLAVSVAHPDITAIQEILNECIEHVGVNLLVKINDDFMKAVVEKKSYELRYPVSGENVKFSKTIDANALWKKLMSLIEKYGNPKVLFENNAEHYSIAECYKADGLGLIAAEPDAEETLGAYDGERAMALNLFSFVDEPFTKNARFDFDRFCEHVRLSVRILDDIIDLETEKIDLILVKIESDPETDEIKRTEKMLWTKIKETCLKGRRIALSVIGESDMMAALGLKFGSDEALDFIDKVHTALSASAYAESVLLARTRGAFPIYNKDKEVKSQFIIRMAKTNSALYSDMCQYGRRNVSMLSIMPMADSAVLAGVSKGVYPMSNIYAMYPSKTTCDDQGVETKENARVAFRLPFKQWMLSGGCEPNAYATAELADKLVSISPFDSYWSKNIDKQQYIKVMQRLKNHVDHGFLLRLGYADCGADALSQLYISAWKNGFDLVTSETNNMSFEKEDKPVVVDYDSMRTIERPAVLDCDVVRFQNNRERWIAFVGLLDGRPYEIFTGLNDEDDGIMLPKSVTSGKIIKSRGADGKSRYDFQFTNKRGFKTTVEGLSQKFDHEYWNYAKLISGVLRYGMPIEQVIKLVAGLQLNNESINTWKIGVERALRKYSNGEGSYLEQVCPNCGNYTLEKLNARVVCRTCGYYRNL